MGENDNLTIKGELDGRFTSYYDPEKHGTMTETVDATPKEAQGTETMNLIPDEVDDDITEKAERVIKTAVLHKEQSSYDIAEKLDENPSNVRNILRNKCPEWYEHTFKDGEGSTWKKDFDADDVAQAIAENGGMSMGELTDEFDTTPKTMRTRLEDIDSLWSETNVDGYHHTAKVFHVGETPAEELADDDTEYEMPDPDELETVEIEIDGQTELVNERLVQEQDTSENDESDVVQEIKTKAEAIKATHHEDECERFARHILRVIEDG